MCLHSFWCEQLKWDRGVEIKIAEDTAGVKGNGNFRKLKCVIMVCCDCNDKHS